jgi:MoxR-like ATPase
MTDYAVSTNLISWPPAAVGFFGWPLDGPEGELVRKLNPGDYLLPKFAQNPNYRRGGGQVDYVRGICAAVEVEYDAMLADYEHRVAGGQGAVPFLMKVTGPLDDKVISGAEPWARVAIEVEELPHPISTSEFLRLRAIPLELARQLKATAAPGRHIQKLPSGALAAVRAAASKSERGHEDLRRLVIVKASTPQEAVQTLAGSGRAPLEGDLAFLVTPTSMPGAFQASSDGSLTVLGESIARAPTDLLELFEKAKARATGAGDFRPSNALRAAKELQDFMSTEKVVLDVPEFPFFYDRYVILARKLSQAVELAKRPLPPTGPASSDDETEDPEGENAEELELDNLRGLTVSSVQAHLPGMVLAPSVLAEAVTAIRSGKHLLLSGPPGTGKSTIASALCRAVVEEQFDIATATADWTTFDTIGGYIPKSGGALEFEPGIVLRALRGGRWLVIDELNRADIDKAFGPLFTLLAGAGENTEDEVVLPFKKGDQNIRIAWSDTRENANTPFALTPVWRLIGTLNVRDKATLFQLSFAFLRRFAVIDVPLPNRDAYRDLYDSWSAGLDDAVRQQTVDAAMRLAFGKKELGPALLRDIAQFTLMGLTETETSTASAPYADPVEAFLTAVRLYAVPQYEGAVKADVDDVLQQLRGVWEDPPPAAWSALARALEAVRMQ